MSTIRIGNGGLGKLHFVASDYFCRAKQADLLGAVVRRFRYGPRTTDYKNLDRIATLSITRNRNSGRLGLSLIREAQGRRRSIRPHLEISCFVDAIYSEAMDVPIYRKIPSRPEIQ